MIIKIEDIEVGDKVQLVDGNVYTVDGIEVDWIDYIIKSNYLGSFSIPLRLVVAIIPKGAELSCHFIERIAHAHGADIEHEYDGGEWDVEYLPRFFRDDRYRVARKVAKSPNQIEKEAIQNEMDSLAARLNKLDVN